MARPRMRSRSNLLNLLGQADCQDQLEPPTSPRRSWLPSPRRLSRARRPLAPTASALQSHTSDDPVRDFSFGVLHMTRRQAHVHRPSGQQQPQSPRGPRSSVPSLAVVLPDEPPMITLTRQRERAVASQLVEACGEAPSFRELAASSQLLEACVDVPPFRVRAYSGSI